MINLLFLLLLIPQITYSANKNYVYMYFFYAPNCKQCEEIKNNFLPQIIKKYTPLLKVKYFDIHKTENYKLILEIEKKYGIIKNPPPTILIGDKILDGKKEIIDYLEQTITYYLNKGDNTFLEEKTSVKKEEFYKKLIEKFKYLGPITIISAGLIDGINPCAFSTIIIFVLYMSFTGYKPTQILLVGLIFSLAVFIAYFFIGIGLFEFVMKIKFLPLVNKLITFLFGITAIILGFLSIYDFYKIQKGKLKEITLQLPDKFKNKIKELIWKKINRRYYLLSSFIVGFLVGILEFPCTGQIYFPIVLILKEIPSLKINALFYLLLYNFMFIIPLLIVFALVYFGTTSDSLTLFLKGKSSLVKILTAILFFSIGFILIFSVI